MPTTPSILVLGGYGNFGRLIARALAPDRSLRILVAGRNRDRAAEIARALGENVAPVALDHTAPDFVDRLRELEPTVLIHTSGPFQGQDYAVAEACLAAGVHYVDIADGRDYVAGIDALGGRAVASDVLIVSGASSLPALSSAVVDRYRGEFSQLREIRHGISSGAKPPGLATMRAVMGYVGHGFQRWEHGRWQRVYGWQDAVRRRFPQPIGTRWLANCDVPDLVLFPQRYPGVESVVFKAGLGFAGTTLATWALSWLVRGGIVRTLLPYAERLHQLAAWIEPVGSAWSAMHVDLTGNDHHGRTLTRTWTVLAGKAHGPNIPCMPAVALARKLVRGELDTRGAMPCVGLLTTEEILTAIPDLDIHTIEG